MKKSTLLFLVCAVFTVFAIFLAQINLVAAISLDITESEIASMAILDLNKPAKFELAINNNEDTDDFNFYSLAGIKIEPSSPIRIPKDQTTRMVLEAYPSGQPRFYSFEYRIKNSAGEIQKESLVINILKLEDVFDITVEEINPESDIAVIHFRNKGGHSFIGMKATFSSPFFIETKEFPLNPKEEKRFEIKIDKERSSGLIAGPYIVNTEVEVEGTKANSDSIIRFSEKSGLETKINKEGFLLQRHEIEKSNMGNVRTTATITFKRNLISALFTTFNQQPTTSDISAFTKNYVFEEELAPGETLEIVARTNWWLLILTLLGIALISYLSKKYLSTKLLVRKKISFVKTKGGEFALKVTIRVKAKEYIERINVVDRLPAMVKIYERYGPITPDKVDEKNRRIEWNIESLNRGEERIFSYIIYSKIGIVGKFEMPETEVIYEYKGKLKEATSNKAFYINEPETKRSRPHIE